MKKINTINDFLFMCLKENNNWRYPLFSILLSIFTFIKIISIPLLIANIQEANNLISKFSIYFIIYGISIILYRRINLKFEAILNQVILSKTISGILRKQEMSKEQLIPNSVYVEISYLVRDVSTCLYFCGYIFPLIISVGFVSIYIFKKIGLKVGILFIFSLILTYFYLFNESKKLSIKSHTVKEENIKLLNNSQDLNMNINSILSHDYLENEILKINNQIIKFKRSLISGFNSRLNIQNFSILVNLLFIISSLILIRKNKLSLIISFILINLSFNQTLIEVIDQMPLLIFYYGNLKIGFSKISKYIEFNEPDNKKKVELQVKKNKVSSNKIIINNLKYSYDDQEFLIIPKLEFDDSKIHILKGKIGSGKSTLLKLLFGYIMPKKGQIMLNDTNTQNIRVWRKNVYYVPQICEIFNKSIKENICYPNKDIQVEEYKLIKNLELDNLYQDLISKNYELGIGGEKLSGGQKQIITLFRALFSKKQIILLDEPTSSLDKDNRRIVHNLIISLKKIKKTLIIATHDNELIELGDHIITFDDGRINTS
ncbi:ABC transporter [seawater metagenome]|uniref:ABC transporter n=1 Tax=seawater metagenome TaxID=1561972 RepID=A0A5E8CMJ5_9ZZZZ